MPESPRISVVIPVRNEEGSVEELAKQLHHVLVRWYEIIFVDDGSSDDTAAKLKSLHEPGRIRVIRFRAPFGKTAALMAGFAATRGEIVVTLDGDLQDDPREIPRFLDRLAGGFDLVNGWKKTRKDPVTKVLPSRIFNYFVRQTTGLSLHDINCGFKAYRGELARSLRLYGEMHRFIPAIAASQGYRIGEIAVTHHPRRHGKSKYGFLRLFKGFFDLGTVLLLTKFEERPAHGFGFAAVGMFVLGLLSALLVAPAVAMERVPLVVLAAVSGACWVGAMVLLAAGWVAEIVVASGSQSDNMPYYSIEEQLD